MTKEGNGAFRTKNRASSAAIDGQPTAAKAHTNGAFGDLPCCNLSTRITPICRTADGGSGLRPRLRSAMSRGGSGR